MKFDAMYPDIFIDGEKLRPDQKILSKITRGEFNLVLSVVRHLADFQKITIDRKSRTVRTLSLKQRIVNDKILSAGVQNAYRY